MAEDKYSKARKARGLRKTVLSPDDEPDTLKRAREEVRNTRGIETIKTGGKIMAGCGGKKMAKGGMMKEEKMMKREGRGMAKADMQKKMAKGGKVMNEGMKALKKEAPEVAAKMGYKKGGAMKKGYHKMPDGKMMKDSAHKGMKKMAKGGSVKKGCDGVATRGKTKGRMI